MVIEFASIELGNDAGGKLVDGYSPDFSLLTSRAQFVDATRGKSFARGNRMREIGFRVSRSEASHANAVSLAHSHPELLPGDGLLTITVPGDTAWQCAGAVLEGCKVVEIVGARVVFEYRFSAQRISRSTDSADVVRDRDYSNAEATTGTYAGGATGMITEADMDTISDN